MLKMDKYGYPEEDELEKIAKWPYKDIQGLMEYVHERWEYANCGYWKTGRKYYHLSTGGWSGNESIIFALRQNQMFWALRWVSSTRGGHYTFEIRKKRN